MDMAAVYQFFVVILLFSGQCCRGAPAVPNESDGLAEVRTNLTAIWAAIDELRAEVREKFDTHVAIENHEHHVHHLGHEDTDHELHHSEKHLQHLEQVHGVTAAGPAGLEPHKPHTPEEKEILRHEHEVHHSNTSFETPEEHASHHDEAMLKHLEEDHNHGEHNGVHHGRMKAVMQHELETHFVGKVHEGHASHHDEDILKHLEEDDGHGPALDRPKPQKPESPTVTTRTKPNRPTKPAEFPQDLKAVCEMKPNKALKNLKLGFQGTVTLTQPKGGPLTLQLNLKGQNRGGVAQGPAKHGFHVHELAPAEEGNCNQAGAHYNPNGANHGSPAASIRHVGDLGNVESTEDHDIVMTIVDYVASLSGPHSILDRALVLHEKEDDLGLNPSSPDSLQTGSAGRRLACCVIRAA